MSEKTLNLIKESGARWVDLRFTDTKGKEHHLTLPLGEVGEDFFLEGKMFDGSSIGGWKGINESDMILMPDDSTAVLDPFTDEPTVGLDHVDWMINFDMVGRLNEVLAVNGDGRLRDLHGTHVDLRDLAPRLLVQLPEHGRRGDLVQEAQAAA